MKSRCQGLILWLGLCLGSFGQTNSPTHEGKTVEQWFQAYVAGAGTRVSPNSYSARNGEFLLLPTMKAESDPVLAAFQIFGGRAVPHLITRLRVGANDSERSRLERRQAVELVHRLGECARPAGPALLALLPAATDDQNEELCAAVRAVQADPQLIKRFLLATNGPRSDAELVQYARRLGWSGGEVACRLGGILGSTNRELAREALGLLEAGGVAAIPAVAQIAGALRSQDQELRYLAVRCLAGLMTSSPSAREALQSVSDDSNDMVRNVARRAWPPAGDRARQSTGQR